VDTKELIRLADEFNLPYIQEEDFITIIGSEQNLLFNILEERQCQLMEIY
jgi:hypothetical protein